jgi:hypothetical protein
MYGVVVCPKCRRPRGVLLKAKTATCQCGKRLYVQRLRVLFTTEEPRELPEAIGRLRAKLSGHLEEFEEAVRDPQWADVTVPSPTSGHGSERRRRQALEVLRSLSRERDGFRMADAEEALASLDLRAADVVDALLQEGLIYEVRRGRYRFV